MLWDKVKASPNADDKSKVPHWQPKDEESLSDYIKAHLEDDLVERGLVVNREVVVISSRTALKDEGERLDLLVQFNSKGISSGAAQMLQVVIEVKGQWNSEVKTAMEAQLCGRYLAKPTLDYGIYLVGWFGEFDWHNDKNLDTRLRGVGQIPDLESAGRHFEQQARSLCAPGAIIKAFVLDAALTRPSQRSASVSKSRKTVSKSSTT